MGEGTATTPPIRRRRIIERPRLIRLLDESPERIKMLVAPAGYGKTTLARQWLAGKEASWYLCTSASADVAALAAGIRAAATQVTREVGDALPARLAITVQSEAEPEFLAELLAADVENWPQDAWLVIDDYHAAQRTDAADRFVEKLLATLGANVLILTRHRPLWASARRIMYGELFELTRTQLAMTETEARQLLKGGDLDPDELLPMARGWPAVLSLASVSDVPVPDLAGAPHLYGFFADEIFRRLDPAIQATLCELAVYDTEGLRVTLRGLGHDHREAVLEVGTDSGFLTEFYDGEYEMHPLLRDFLIRKLTGQRADVVDGAIERSANLLVKHRLWDEAHDLIEKFRRVDLIPALLHAWLPDLLASGRTTTVQSLIDSAPDDSASVKLASAELAFRGGRFHESEGLAKLASAESTDVELTARALLTAGRAAHAASREEHSALYYAKVSTIDCSQGLRRIGLLGELAATIELEKQDAVGLLASLGPPDALPPDERVILVSRIINLETRFGLPVSVDEGRAMWQLLDRVRDPVARSSFRNVFGFSLAAMGHLDEADALTDQQQEDIEKSRLDFVIPYALVTRALVGLMRHEYLAAQELLDEAEERSLRSGDQTAYFIAWAVRTRLYNAQAAYDVSLARAFPQARSQTKSLYGELMASYAVALAGSGEPMRAIEYARRSQATSGAIEISGSAPCAIAIVELRGGNPGEALSQLRRALGAVARCGMIEAFVSAYRGCPELLLCLLEDPEIHDDLRRVLTIAGDASLTPRATATGTVLDLSPREKEVLSLVARGMSNAAIGDRLFISPVTVKVHVRHIFEKLGVKSRAEAALRAGQLGRD